MTVGSHFVNHTAQGLQPYLDFLWDLYSLGFSIFRPNGAKEHKVWVHFVSILFLICMAWMERGGFFMNSKTWMVMSFVPKCDGELKCLLTLLSGLFNSMSRK